MAVAGHGDSLRLRCQREGARGGAQGPLVASVGCGSIRVMNAHSWFACWRLGAGLGWLLALATACGAPAKAPSDDPSDYSFVGISSEIAVSDPVWVVPSTRLPSETPPMQANNNVEIAHHGDRLFLAWRTSENHFASKNTKLYVVSSRDAGRTFEHELTVALGADTREPRFISLAGTLSFFFFEAGTDPFGFEPKHLWRTTRRGPHDWTPLERAGEDGEVLWGLKVRGGKAWMTSYAGGHYDQGLSTLEVRFKVSTDGVNFVPVNPARPVVYTGGVSEVAFEFDTDGSLWAVTRNEDGDATGFGSHVCHAPAGELANWDCGLRSSPERYDSPAMFRQGDDLYLVARRDVGGPFDEGRSDLAFADQKRTYLIDYSTRAKRTALYKLDKAQRQVVFLRELPSAGDTAFPSVRRIDARTLLVANYTSPLTDPDRSWLVGQTSQEGTQIYFVTLSFGAPARAPLGVAP